MTVDIMKSAIVAEFQAAMKQRKAALAILEKLLAGFDPAHEWPDNSEVRLTNFSTRRNRVTLGEIRSALGEVNPFGLGK